MRISYFSRRLNYSSGGGEQCDLYLKNLLKENRKNKVIMIAELNNKSIIQSQKRNLKNKVMEEVDELYFYLRNIKYILKSDLIIITGRSLSASIISLIKYKKTVHNIHGKTNKLALRIFRISKSILFFWGNSYEMSKKPKFERLQTFLIPSSFLTRKIIYKENIENNKKDLNIEPNILWIGRLEPIKDPLLFLESLKYLKNTNISWKSIVIGNGSLKEKVSKTIKKINNNKNPKIKFMGNIKNEEIGNYYKKGKILVITSKTENFPLIILEALLNNLKIISIPIKELQNSMFSKYIKFSISSDPKDLADTIETSLKMSLSIKDSIEIKHNVLKLYKNQRKELLKWFK